MSEIKATRSEYPLNQVQLERVKRYLEEDPKFRTSHKDMTDTVYEIEDGLFGVVLLREGNNPLVRLLTVGSIYEKIIEGLPKIIGGIR
jgi:hypothetical protein